MVFLVRHGRTRANADGVLAGRLPGVDLDDTGVAQAHAVGERMSALALHAVVTSPLERTRQTADAILSAQTATVPLHVDEGFAECDYGDWAGQQLKALAKDPLWRQVQAHPSAVTFPGGESMPAMQHRAVAAVRTWNAEFGPDSRYAIVSHGDIIKAILADALGLHLDHFQRITVDPCSVSVVSYTPHRPFVLRMNDSGEDLRRYAATPKRRSKKTSDAAVGGGAG